MNQTYNQLDNRVDKNIAIRNIFFYIIIFFVASSALSVFFINIYSLIKGIPYSTLSNPDTDEYQTMSIILNPILQISVYLLLAAVIGLNSKKWLVEDSNGLFKNRDKYVGWAVIGMVLLYAVNILFSIFFTNVLHITDSSDNQAAIVSMLQTIPGILCMGIFTVFLAPMVEELIFRRSVFTFFKNKNVAVIISALIFGFIHVSSACFTDLIGIMQNTVTFKTLLIDFSYILIYGSMGLILSLLYKKTNNIYPVIMAHSLNNLLSFIFSLIALLA